MALHVGKDRMGETSGRRWHGIIIPKWRREEKRQSKETLEGGF
jgi:hypothetical protein